MSLNRGHIIVYIVIEPSELLVRIVSLLLIEKHRLQLNCGINTQLDWMAQHEQQNVLKDGIMGCNRYSSAIILLCGTSWQASKRIYNNRTPHARCCWIGTPLKEEVSKSQRSSPEDCQCLWSVRGAALFTCHRTFISRVERT